jgi:hypothetical protein
MGEEAEMDKKSGPPAEHLYSTLEALLKEGFERS